MSLVPHRCSAGDGAACASDAPELTWSDWIVGLAPELFAKAIMGGEGPTSEREARDKDLQCSACDSHEPRQASAIVA